MLDLFLLPGLDGTGRLFDPFLRALPPTFVPRVVRFPSDQVCDYGELLGRIELPGGPFAVVAESYSGPLALRLAARKPAGLRAVILVASFVRSPIAFLPSRLRPVVRSALFRLGAPSFAVRAILLGRDAEADLVRDFQDYLRSVSPDVLAARVREVLSVDVESELRRCPAPILYLRGLRDRLVPRRVAPEMKTLRPDLEVGDLDAPHLLLQRRPAESARAVEVFLREVCSIGMGTIGPSLPM